MARTPNTYEPELAPMPSNTEGSLQHTQAAAAHQTEIANRFGDGLPYDRNRVVSEAQFYMEQSAEAMLEAGKRLIILKENEPHGEFEGVIKDRLGLASRTARLMMQATIKYSSPRLESKRQALAVLGKTKLFELMTEDDDELAELAEGGTVAGLTLDEVDRMTTRELRHALREARDNAAANAKITANKDAKINKLDAELTKLKSPNSEPLIEVLPPDEIAQQLLAETREFADEINGRVVGKLLPAFRALDTHDQTHGSRHNIEMAGLVASIESKLNELRSNFDLPRNLDGDNTPDWMRDDAEAAIAEALDHSVGVNRKVLTEADQLGFDADFSEFADV